MKHMESHYQYTREEIVDGTILLIFCTTTDNVAFSCFFNAIPALLVLYHTLELRGDVEIDTS